MALPPIPGLAFLARYVDVQGIVDALLAAYGTYGYMLVFLGAWMEHFILLGVIVPGGTMVSFGGAAARLGSLQLPLTIAFAALGMIAGASTDYWLGRWGLARLLLRSRLGPRVQPGLDRAFSLLQRHGWWAITLVHAMGAGRSAMALTAGASRMPFWRFVLCEVPAALLWSVIFNSLGYGIATNLSMIQRVIQHAGVGIALAIALAFLIRWLRRWQRRRGAGGSALA